MSLRRVAHCVAAAIAACAGDCAAAAVASGDCDAFGDCATDDVSALLTFQRPEARRGLPRLRWERPAPWWRMGPPSLTSGFQKCEMGERRWGCPLHGMQGQPTLVYPGGDTGCMSGEAYAFAVYPGASDKLAFYFQGGGACWVANGAVGRQPVFHCTRDMDTALQTSGRGWGILNATNARNPFREWTIVEPLYCSGDAFVGHGDMTVGNETFKQRGFQNALAAKEWAAQHFRGVLSNFAVMGFSAGSLGTQSWAMSLLSAFSFRRGAVLLDSYAGLFPPSTQEAVIKEWGGCDTSLWPAAVRSMCHEGNLTVQYVGEETMRAFPDVAFGSIQSKGDGTQLWFYKGMAQSFGRAQDMGMTGPQFYARTNDIFVRYRSSSPNFAVYYIDGNHHCFLTSSDLVFKASTAGMAAPPPDDKPTLLEWVERLVGHRDCRSECDGPVEAPAPGRGSAAYCAQHLVSLPLEMRAGHHGRPWWKRPAPIKAHV